MQKKVEHLAKDCRIRKKLKNKSIQEELDDKDNDNNDKEMGFVTGLE